MICKKCGCIFNEKYSKYSNGDFCSLFCARSYSSKIVKGSKIVQCIVCGKPIEVYIRCSNNNKCDTCSPYIKIIVNGKKKVVKRKSIKKCSCCGELICLHKKICNKRKLIPSLVKYFGFNKKCIGSLEYYNEFDRIKNIIENEYYNNHIGIIGLSELYGHKNIRNFWKILKSIGISIRSCSNGLKNAILYGKKTSFNNFKYKSGWHETWNGKQVFYRSSYELDYCNELDEKHINYEMEKLRILYWDSQKHVQRVAIPDFYLPDNNEIIEIKSNWTYDEINMKDKLKSYKEHGYKFKLILEHKEIYL
jgi:hypothetical protein